MNQKERSLVSAKVAWVAVAVTVVSAYKLSLVAYETGNWRGMWFSLTHVIIVAIGATLSLREVR
jgi:hypothetical protein